MTAPEYLRVKAEELAALHTVSHVVDSKQLGQCTAPARLREIAQRFEAMERALDRLAMAGVRGGAPVRSEPGPESGPRGETPLTDPHAVGTMGARSTHSLRKDAL